MWDKPFTTALPPDIQRGTTHELVVRVEKDGFAAGIWEPVRIVAE